MKRGKLESRKNWDKFQKDRKWLFAPVDIVEDSKLSAQAKLMFIILNSYCNNYGICHAGNETLCTKVSLKKTMVKTYIKELKERELITVKIIPGHKWPRQIFINFDGLTRRYPIKKTDENGPIKLKKAFISPYPLEKHPDYETLKDIYRYRPAGKNYLYFIASAKK